MLDWQSESFSGRERLGYMLLGLLAFGDRVTVLSGLPRADGKAAAPSDVSDFLLGVISAHRTLRAALASEPPVRVAAAVTEPKGPSDPALLR